MGQKFNILLLATLLLVKSAYMKDMNETPCQKLAEKNPTEIIGSTKTPIDDSFVLRIFDREKIFQKYEVHSLMDDILLVTEGTLHEHQKALTIEGAYLYKCQEYRDHITKKKAEIENKILEFEKKQRKNGLKNFLNKIQKDKKPTVYPFDTSLDEEMHCLPLLNSQFLPKEDYIKFGHNWHKDTFTLPNNIRCTFT